MFDKILRAISAVFGAFVGYGVYLLTNLWCVETGIISKYSLSPFQSKIIPVIFAIIFSIIFFWLGPIFRKQGNKLADSIGDDLKSTSLSDIIASVIGLIVGLVIALLITQIFIPISNPYIYAFLVMIVYIIMGFFGVVVARKKGKELVSQIIKERKKDSKENNRVGLMKSKRKNEGTPKILDTSVIIDGRIAEIMKTGFLEGQIVIPEFVLVELRHIADSADSLKRIRGRRGLDILKKIQEDYGVEIYNTDNEKLLKDIPEVDVKLLKLAQIMKGKVVTNDFNLNKVAGINGVGVLNINELANTLKPVVIPGETMVVDLVKEGKDNVQAVAYLDDGTMVVVEDGRPMLGKTATINVTSVLQTSAGRMIFGRLKK